MESEQHRRKAVKNSNCASRPACVIDCEQPISLELNRQTNSDRDHIGTKGNTIYTWPDTFVDTGIDSTDLEQRIENLFDNQPEQTARLYRLRTSNWLSPEDLFRTNTPRQLNLTNTEIRISLDYFKQCIIRSKQMTNTYDDKEATVALLKERESDIEIAATIGLELLNINSELSDKVDNLTSNLNTSKEMICQLKYELESKQKLLASAFDVDEANVDNDRSTNSQTDVRKWRDQIKRLDAENRGLKHQAEALQREAEECENKEKMLLTSCTCKLGAANAKLDTLYKQVRKKSDECDDLKCRIEQLRGQVITLQSTIKMLTDENDELIEKIASAKSVQGDLEQQVSNLNDSYKECYDVLEISRRDARIWKSRAMSLDYQAQSCAGAKLASRLRSDCERRSLDLPTDEGHSSIHWSDPKATPGSQLSPTLSTSDESELATKLRLCRLVNERPVDFDGGSHTSRRTLADSGLQSDFDLADSSIGLMELPKQVAINGKLQGGGVTLRRVSVKKPGQLPKIMIVKPFEGSRCLERWRELSVPSIARVLQPRLPGIFSRYDILGSENNPLPG